MNYVEARYLSAATGKFIQVDPVIISGDKIDVQQIDPQSFNSYSYSRNNPIVLADKDGEFWQAVVVAALMYAPAIVNGLQNLLTPLGQDTIFGSSKTLNDKNSSKLAKTGAVASIALVGSPVKTTIAPAGRSLLAAKYFHEVALGNIDDIVNMNGLYKANQGFKFTGKAWSVGKAHDPIANLVGHFYKHGAQVGAKTVKEYYDLAKSLMNSVKGFDDPFRSGDKIFFDVKTNVKTVLNSAGEIASYYIENRSNVINAYKTIINNMK